MEKKPPYYCIPPFTLFHVQEVNRVLVLTGTPQHACLVQFRYFGFGPDGVARLKSMATLNIIFFYIKYSTGITY